MFILRAIRSFLTNMFPNERKLTIEQRSEINRVMCVYELTTLELYKIVYQDRRPLFCNCVRGIEDLTKIEANEIMHYCLAFPKTMEREVRALNEDFVNLWN